MATIEAKKTDRRVIRTRNAIRKAFTDLLAETAYNKITITALAKRADVDRKSSTPTIHRWTICSKT